MKKILFIFTIILGVFAHSQIRIYFKRPSTWGTAIPKIYVFNTLYISTTPWPGVDLSPTCNPDWFIFNAPGQASFVNFVINNGGTGTGNQTQDLTTSATVYYEFNTTTNQAFVSPVNPMIPNPCLKIKPDSGTFYTGTNVKVTLEASDYKDNTTPTIYYTTDGTEPTTYSQSFAYTGELNFSSGTNTVKAFAQIPSGDYSATLTKQYNFTTNGIMVKFVLEDGLLANWGGVIPNIHFWNVQTSSGNPTIADTIWPGVNMTPTGTTNEYQYFFQYATSVNVIFNNGNSGTGNQTSDILNKTNSFTFYYPSAKLSANNFSTNKSSKIYPNPAKDFVKISSLKKVKTISITDAKGSLVKSEIPLLNEINISNLPKGFYLMKITFEDGTSVVEKLIKQ